MRKLVVFNQVSLDGFFSDPDGGLDWAHKSDREWKAFVANNARTRGGLLLFGRVTYEMMASYWPTSFAMKNDPAVATSMNAMPKLVFSTTLEAATWNNTRLVKRGLTAEVRKLKGGSGKPIVVMGSGSIVSQLAQEGLIDELQLVVNPIVLGEGRSMFEGVRNTLDFKPSKTRRFKNGNVLLSYKPAAPR
jgi:dihydrofolate reductase